MKKIFKTIVLFALCAVCSLSLLTSCKKSTDDIKAPAGFSVCTSDVADCYFFYPMSVWLPSESAGFLSLVKADHSEDNSSVVLNSWEVEVPLGSSADSYMSLKEYWNGIPKSEGLDGVQSFDGYVKTLSELINGYAVVSDEEIKVGDHDAYSVVYTGDIAGAKIKVKQVCIAVAKGNHTKVYCFTYTSTPDSYDYNIQAVNSMIDSFSLK